MKCKIYCHFVKIYLQFVQIFIHLLRQKYQIMKLLFPHRFKKSSRVLFYLFFFFGIIYIYFLEGNTKLEEIFTFRVLALFSQEFMGSNESGWIETMFLDEILSVCIIIFGVLTGFSKERHEDELIDKLRNDSLRLSLFVNYSLLLITVLSIFGMTFLNVMLGQLFFILFLFNLIFDMKLIKHYKSASND
jgi:hypothetical protein